MTKRRMFEAYDRVYSYEHQSYGWVTRVGSGTPSEWVDVTWDYLQYPGSHRRGSRVSGSSLAKLSRVNTVGTRCPRCKGGGIVV